MAHYALLDENNIVVKVITGNDEDVEKQGITDWEQYYSEYHGMRCLRTSYNTWHNEHSLGGVPFRGNYASPGMRYDEDLDAFCETEKEFDSWIFDESICGFKAPVDKVPNTTKYKHPETGKMELRYSEAFAWDEGKGEWVAFRRFDYKMRTYEALNLETGEWEIVVQNIDEIEADQTA